MKVFSVFLLTVLLFLQNSYANELPPGLKKTSDWSLINFRAFVSGAFQNNGSSSFSGGLDWHPTYRALDEIELGLNLGVVPMKGTTSVFLATEYQFTAAFTGFGFIVPEVDLGAQTWVTNGTKILAGGTLYFDIELPEFLSVIDTLFVAYNYFGLDTIPVHQIRVGLSIKF